VGQGELVGLLSARCVAAAARAEGIENPLDDRGLPGQTELDAAARALRLRRLDADRVLEWHRVE
jgi:hypothetical protein